MPPVETNPEVTVAVSCVELLKLVMRNVPFHRTMAPETKPDPLTVRLKPPLPGVIAVGLSDEIVGPLLAPILNGKELETSPLVVTVMLAAPAETIRLAGTEAVSCVEFTKLVVRGVPLNDTMDVFWKLLPLTVRVKALPPGVAKFGLRPVTVGTPFDPMTAK